MKLKSLVRYKGREKEEEREEERRNASKKVKMLIIINMIVGNPFNDLFLHLAWMANE